MLSADRSRVFQEVLAAYLEAKEKGEHVDAEKLAKQHPELAEELNEFFANEKKFASAAGDLAGAPTAPHPPVIERRVGEYEILGEIARGGMGVVYRARHVSLQRQVALKMMLAGAFAGKDGVRRFRGEAEAVADLDHPNIVPIYDSGEHQGQAYFCMKLIDGPSLKQEMASYLGKPEDAARLIAQIAHAIHHAHQRGILHRDLKPGNILLQNGKLQIEKNQSKKKKAYPVSGIPQSAIFNPQFAIPYVTDFGLAKRFQDDGKASQSTAVVGTAAYMAPEQATGRHALTVGADVYSLGAVLFELLTGRPPFVGDNQMEVLLQLVDKEPPAPTDLRPSLDADLAQICLKCLRKDPAERYPSAEALAVELEQWLEGEPVSVRAPTRSERVWRLVRRRPALVFSCFLMTLVLIAGVTLSMGGNWYLNRLTGQLKDANEELEQTTEQARINAETAQQQESIARAAAERERLARIDLETITAKEKASRDAKLQALEESRRLLIEQFIAGGEQHLLRDDPLGAAVWFGAALAHDPGDPERESLHRIRIGAVLRQTPPLTQMVFNVPVRQLRLSPAGHRLAAVDKTGAVSLWDTKTGKPVSETRSLDAAACEFSPDGQWLVSFGNDVQARLWSADTGLPHGNPLVHTQPVRAAVFSPDGKWLATTTADRVRFWDPATAKPMLMIKTDKELRAPAFRADGKKFIGIVEGAKRGALHLWDLTTGKEEALPMPTKPNSPNVRSAGFSRDGKRIYAVATNAILLWNAGTKNDPKVIVTEGAKGDRAPIFAPHVDAYFQPADSEIRVIELPSNKSAFVLKHDSQVQIAQFSPTGKFIATSSANRGVHLWRADTGRPFCAPLPIGQSVTALAFSADDHWLACASADNIVRVWRLTGLERDKAVNLTRIKATLLSVSPDGAHALFNLGKATDVWDIDKRKSIASLPGLDFAKSARWSTDGKSVAIANSTEARVFSLPAGGPLTPAWKIGQPPPELAEEWALWGRGLYQKSQSTKTKHVLDCDGRRLAVWRNKGALEIEEMSSERRQPIKLAVVPEVFAFSPDRRFGVAGFKDGSLRIWDLTDAKPSTSFFWHGEPVRQIAYSADGRFLASASASGRVRVWDAAAGQPLTPAFSMSGPPAGFAFHPDGTMLHGWTTEGRLHTWSLAPTQNSPADLLRRIHLAAGQKPDALSRSLIPLDADELRTLWGGEQ